MSEVDTYAGSVCMYNSPMRCEKGQHYLYTAWPIHIYRRGLGVTLTSISSLKKLFSSSFLAIIPSNRSLISISPLFHHCFSLLTPRLRPINNDGPSNPLPKPPSLNPSHLRHINGNLGPEYK